MKHSHGKLGTTGHLVIGLLFLLFGLLVGPVQAHHCKGSHAGAPECDPPPGGGGAARSI